MARDNVPIVAGAINAITSEGAGVAISVANGSNLLAGSFTDNLVLVVLNTFAGALNVTIRAGVGGKAGGGAAFRADLGDLVVSALQTAQRQYIFLEAARFVQADGSINIDWQATFTGTVFAFKLPPETQ